MMLWYWLCLGVLASLRGRLNLILILVSRLPLTLTMPNSLLGWLDGHATRCWLVKLAFVVVAAAVLAGLAVFSSQHSL